MLILLRICVLWLQLLLLREARRAARVQRCRGGVQLELVMLLLSVLRLRDLFTWPNTLREWIVLMRVGILRMMRLLLHLHVLLHLQIAMLLMVLP